MNKPVVIRQVERPPADAVAALATYGVSTVHEAQGRCGLLASYMRPIYPGAAIAGSAVTVSLPPGVKGLVIDAGCRDVRSLSAMKFPVWSRAVSSQGTVKSTLGSVNVSVVCAGAQVEAGDVMVADEDGVVVVRRSVLREVAAAAEQRTRKEEVTRERLAHGELGLDIYGLRKKVAELGLKYI